MTAVVTGAGRGLGAALAITLADEGCRVVLCGRDRRKLSGTAEMIARRTERPSDIVDLDLADTSSVEAAIAQISGSHASLDLLVNNGAAWLPASDGVYAACDVAATVNSAVTGTFLFTQGLLPLLFRSQRPDIVTIGSMNGLPNAGLRGASLPMQAAKAGQTAFADGLRQLLVGTPGRSICVYPPDLDDTLPGEPSWEAALARSKGSSATSRDVVEAVLFAVTRPRHVTLATIVIDADVGGMWG